MTTLKYDFVSMPTHLTPGSVGAVPCTIIACAHKAEKVEYEMGINSVHAVIHQSVNQSDSPSIF